ncbi:Uncharacterized protein GBIM_10824, partial [Gryllus bimaculatus]
MLTELDESVGKVVQALEQKRMLENTLILFMSDNGAPTFGIYQNWGSNYPLRGIKDTFWEGGVRGVAALWGTMLRGKEEDLVQPLDGVNQWNWLTGKQDNSARNETLINIDEVQNASAIIVGPWKLVQGTKSAEYNDYYGDSGAQRGTPPIGARHVWGSRAGRAIAHALGPRRLLDQPAMDATRGAAAVSCTRAGSNCDITRPEQFCLFHILNDPCEERNVADQHPDVVRDLLI